jgi:hypothetical protein
MNTIDRLLAAYHAIYEIIASQYLAPDAINNKYDEAGAIAYHIGYLLGTRKLDALKLEMMHKIDPAVDRAKFFAGYQRGTWTRPKKVVAGAYNPWEAAGLA